MKKIICLLLCAATLCWNTIPAFADDPAMEGSGLLDGSQTAEDPPNLNDPATPLPPGSNPENPTPVPDNENGGQNENQNPGGENNQGGQTPPTDPTPPPPPPVLDSGVTVDPNQLTVINAAQFKSIAFSAGTITLTYQNAAANPRTITKPATAGGCRVDGDPSGTTLTFSSFTMPISLAGAPANAPQPYSYIAVGNVAAPAGLTVNGTLALQPENAAMKTATLSGTISAGTINAAKLGIQLNGNVTAAQLGNVGDMKVLGGASTIANLSAKSLTMTSGTITSSGTIYTEDGGKIDLSGGVIASNGIVQPGGPLTVAPSANGAQALSAAQIAASGPITISTRVTANAVSSTKDLQINGNGSLAVTRHPTNGNFYGQVVSNGTITVAGYLSAAGDIQAQNVTVSGSLVSDGALTPAGTLTVNNGGSIDGSGSIQAAEYVLNGLVNVKDFTATKALTLGNRVKLSGTLSAPSLTVTGNVKASRVTVSGDVSVQGELVAETLSAGGTVSVGSGRSEATFSAKTIAANKLYSANALLIPNTTLDIKGGGVDVRGELRVGGGTVTGPLSATHVTLGGTFNGNSVTSTSGGVSAQAMTLSGALRAADGISLNGAFNGKSVVADRGNITSNSNGVIVNADRVEALNGATNLGASATVHGRVYGKNGVSMNGGRCDSIYSDGNVNLRGTVNAGNITAKTLSVSGAVTADDVNCTTGTVDSNASLRCDSLKATGALTVRGTINSSGNVKGNPVTTPSGGVIHANSVNGAKDNYTGKLTITTPYINKNIYVELKRSGESSSGFHVGTDKNGKATFTGLAAGNYTVYAESGSNARRGSVYVSSSGTTTLDLRSKAGASGGGQTTGGGSYFDEDEFWEDVYDDIRSARSGDTVRVSASKADSVPVWLLQELEGRPVTLKLTHGRDSVTIDGENMHPIPNNRVFYRFDDLADLYEFPPESSSSHSSSSRPSSSSQAPAPPPTATPLPEPAPVQPAPSVPAPAPAPLPQPPATVTPSIPEEESSSEESSEPEESDPDGSEPEESEPEPPEEPEEPKDVPAEKKTNMLPVAVAVILILLSLGGIAVGYVVYRHSRANSSIYDDDDDE